jgi:hypothetical protein
MALLVLSLWIFLLGSDRILWNVTKGLLPVAGISETLYADPGEGKVLSSIIDTIRQESGPDDTILPLNASPFLYVVTPRRGPGARDIVMPGTFYDDADEAAFVEKIAASPPAVIVWPHVAFDNRPDRAITVVAPRLVAWVMPRYQRVLHTKRYSVFKYVGEPD